MSELDTQIRQSRILVVDDESFNLSLVARFLKSEGYENVETLSDSTQAIALHLEKDFDLILLDIHMPVMDGFEVMQALRDLPRADYLPILVFTGDQDHETRIKALQLGAKDFLTKPLTKSEASSRIRNMLEVRALYNQNRRERDAYQSLLLNTLPATIVARLNAGETEIADNLEDITVLFADLVGFTSASSVLPADKILSDINRVFESFDTLADQFHIEKIKTIGDCYMAVSGLTGDGVEATFCMVEFALATLEKLDDLRPTLHHPFHVRIGISLGPVVAGVLRGKRSIFDVWGDTVNVASRYESSGVPNRVHIAKPVADRIRESYAIEERPAIDLRGKGSMPSFLLCERLNEPQSLGSAINS